MPNLTTPFLKLSGDTERDLKQIEQWSVSLVDELKSLLCNLDGGNVIEASSVKAQNIDCTTAKIKDAQVQSMTADKLTAGVIDVSEGISISGSHDDKESGGSSGSMDITNESIEMREDGVLRIAIGRDEDGNYIFTVQSADKTTGIYMNDKGEVYLTGAIRTTKDCSVGNFLTVGDIGGAAVYFKSPTGGNDAEIVLDGEDLHIRTPKGGVYINGRLIE